MYRIIFYTRTEDGSPTQAMFYAERLKELKRTLHAWYGTTMYSVKISDIISIERV